VRYGQWYHYFQKDKLALTTTQLALTTIQPALTTIQPAMRWCYKPENA